MPSDLREQIERTVRELAAKVDGKRAEWLSARTPETFRRMEMDVSEVARSFADAIVAALLRAMTADAKFEAEASGAARELCGRRMRHGGRRRVSVAMLGGSRVDVEVEYIKENRRSGSPLGAAGRRGPTGSGLYPVLAALGIAWNVTPALAAEITRQVADSDSVRAARSALERRGIDLGHKQTLRIVNAVGSRAVDHRDTWLLNAAEQPAAASGMLRGRRVVISTDGGRIRERVVRGRRSQKTGHYRFDAPWREPKVLTIYVVDNKGRVEKSFRPIYDGTMGDCDNMFVMLVGYLKALGAHEAKQLIILGDGAKWIWERTSLLAEELGIPRDRVVEIIDWFHAVETLHAVADAVARWPSGSREAWLRSAQTALYAGNMHRLMALFDRLAVGRRTRAINEHREYFRRNVVRMQYRAFVARKLPRGSGSVESAIRRIVNMRMKGNGMFWNRENAESMLLVRSYLKAGRFDDLIDWSLQCATSWWRPAHASSRPTPIS